MGSDARSSAPPTTSLPCDSWEDPIIAELDAYREQQAAHFGYDVVKLLEESESRQMIPIREQISTWGVKPDAEPVLPPNGNEPWEDPIIAELDAYREQHAARFDQESGSTTHLKPDL